MNRLYLTNTLSNSKEEFKPIKKDKIGIYTCGPTVYNYAHIGNLRSYVFADILVRVLRYNYGDKNIKWVMNITDVDDKTIRDAKINFPDLEPFAALKRLTSEYENIFWDDLKKMNVNMPDKITRAADMAYIARMQKLIQDIFDKGYGYVKEGSVYFDVKKYSENYSYGKLVKLDTSKLKNGASVDADEYEKENIQDFVLWKGRKEGEPFWDFDLNGKALPGRPGWHIECSAMAEAELGLPFDIHTGGIDLKFPHHENEIAQSVIGYAVAEPVKFWMHNEHLLIDGMRMGKRFKNFYTTKDLEEKGFKPLAYRFYCMQTNYAKRMNFTWEGLKAAQEGMEHLANQIRNLQLNTVHENNLINQEFKNKFFQAINDDLNMAQALAMTQELLKSNLPAKEKYATALDFNRVLGLISEETDNLPLEVKKIMADRALARKNNNWNESDRLRQEIEKLGYAVEDTVGGQRVYKK